MDSREREGELKRRWAGELPSDLAEQIIGRFRSSGDRVRFSAISSAWRRSANEISRHRKRPRLATAPPSHPPWLMLAGPQGEDDDRRSFYSFSEDKFYPVHLPQIRSHSFVFGSGEGWIITMDPLTADLQLTDLLTGSVHKLPPITTLSCVEDAGVFNADGQLAGYTCRPWRRSRPLPKSLQKFISCSEPEPIYWESGYEFGVELEQEEEEEEEGEEEELGDDGYSIVFLICSKPDRFMFARVGEDESWIEFAGIHNFADAACCSPTKTRSGSSVVRTWTAATSPTWSFTGDSFTPRLAQAGPWRSILVLYRRPATALTFCRRRIPASTGRREIRMYLTWFPPLRIRIVCCL